MDDMGVASDYYHYYYYKIIYSRRINIINRASIIAN